MKYRRSLLLYEDSPDYGAFLRTVIVAVPLLLLATGFYLHLRGNDAGAVVMVVETLFLAFVFWLVFPRKYRVYEDHLSIALGGPLALRYGFERITGVQVTRRSQFTMNFVTKVAMTYVIITRRQGLSIAITPRNNEAFAQNANLALSEWKRTHAVATRPATRYLR